MSNKLLPEDTKDSFNQFENHQNSCLTIIVEGEDDIKFYGSYINNHHKTYFDHIHIRTVTDYNSKYTTKNKEFVLRLCKEVTNKKNLLFIVDRDLDELIDRNIHNGYTNLYITDCYSHENYYMQCEYVKNKLHNKNISNPYYKKLQDDEITSIFENFYNKLSLLMSYKHHLKKNDTQQHSNIDWDNGNINKNLSPDMTEQDIQQLLSITHTKICPNIISFWQDMDNKIKFTRGKYLIVLLQNEYGISIDRKNDGQYLSSIQSFDDYLNQMISKQTT